MPAPVSHTPHHQHHQVWQAAVVLLLQVVQQQVLVLPADCCILAQQHQELILIPHSRTSCHPLQQTRQAIDNGAVSGLLQH
jgi:hypothetical protein